MAEENSLFRAIETHDAHLPECSDDALIMDDAIYLVRVGHTQRLCDNILSLAQGNGITAGRVLRLIARNVVTTDGGKGLKDEFLETYPFTHAALDYLIRTFADPETKK